MHEENFIELLNAILYQAAKDYIQNNPAKCAGETTRDDILKNLDRFGTHGEVIANELYAHENEIRERINLWEEKETA